MHKYETSLGDLDLTFDLAVVDLTFKILSGLYLRSNKLQNFILGWDIR